MLPPGDEDDLQATILLHSLGQTSTEVSAHASQTNNSDSHHASFSFSRMAVSELEYTR
jgi:hypothetical protein